jgi:hypothetical protein
MKRMMTFLAVLPATLFGCGNDDLSTELADQIMESAIETADDSAEDAYVESAGDLGDAYGMRGGVGGALTRGCMEITTVPDPLPADPAQRPDHYTVAWQFNDCGWRIFTQNGTRSIDFTRNADGSRDILGSRDVQRVQRFGDHVDIDSSGSLHAVGDRASGNVVRTITLEEHRVRTRPSGRVVFDVDISTSNLAVDTTISADQEIRRVFNGDITVSGRNRDFELVTTFNALVREPATCCHPIGGSVTQVLSEDGEEVRERTYTFSEACGMVEREDGTSFELGGC